MRPPAPGSSPLSLQTPRSRQRPQQSRALFRGRRPGRSPRPPLEIWRQAITGLVLLAAGIGLGQAVVALPEWANSLELLATGGGHLLRGLHALGLGLVQLGGLLGLLLLGLLALLLMLAGAMRLIRILLPARRRGRRS